MNKEQEELLDETYRKYADSHWTPPSNPEGKLLSDQLFSLIPMEHSKESFINKIKTDNEFAKKWGVKVEVRELSLEERMKILEEKHPLYYLEQQLGGEDIFTRNNIPTRAISLMFNMRSTDVGLGLGFNLASYGLLLIMIAKQVNMIPDELIYNGGDVHLYKNHTEPIKEQLNRTPFELPTVELLGEVDDIAHYELDDIVLKNYKSHPTIKMPLSN